MSLHPTFVEYIDGAMQYLLAETDKDNISIREVKAHFCNFIRKMIKNFSRKYNPLTPPKKGVCGWRIGVLQFTS